MSWTIEFGGSTVLQTVKCNFISLLARFKSTSLATKVLCHDHMDAFHSVHHFRSTTAVLHDASMHFCVDSFPLLSI